MLHLFYSITHVGSTVCNRQNHWVSLPQRTRIFKRGICFIVDPSPSHPRQKHLQPKGVWQYFCCMLPESLNLTIHLHNDRYDKFFNKTTEKYSHLQFFPCWWPKLTPHHPCLLQQLLKPCGLYYTISNVLTVEEV